ncbi:MAG: alpha/beta fold hydrolase [Pseudomonadota bacterium]|nr:alpha/beta fold hydrolase [Pseudomonadota bacterium]
MALSSSLPVSAKNSTNVRAVERDPDFRAWVSETLAAIDALEGAVPAPPVAPRAAAAPWYLRAGFATLGTLAPPLATAWAERLFLTAPRPPAPPKEVAALATAHAGSVIVDGLRLATWTWVPLRHPDVPRSTVLLVHGWGGRGGQLAGFVPGLLAAGHAVVTFDAPGHGASEGRTSSLVEVGRAVRGVAAALPSPVHAVIAHSMGGAATALALDAGLALARAVFVAPPRAASEWVHTFSAVLGLSDEVRDGMQRNIEGRLQVSWDDLDMATVAPRMQTPLLVIHDTDDKEVPYAGSSATVAAWPGASLHTTAKLGHKRILDDADVIARAVAFVVA